MNKKCAILLFFISVNLSGCASYSDINLTSFTTATVIDVDEEGKPVVYMECFMSNFSQLDNAVMGVRSVMVGRGETITEAIQKINQTSRQQLSTVYSKMLIFTKKAAEQGLEDYLDVLVRDQEFLLRPYIIIFDGDPTTLLNLDIVQGDFEGIYLEDLFRSDKVSNLMRPYKLFDYINMMSTEGHIAVMGIVSVVESEVDPYIGIKEAAVIQENKMVETLTENEFKTYCLLDGKSKTTLLTIPNPEDDQAKITLTALKTSSKKSIEYSGKVGSLIHYKIEVKLTLSINETQKSLDLEDEQIRKKMVEEVKQKIVDEGLELFNKYKLMDIDLFDVEDALYRKYPQYQLKDVIGNTELEIVVNTRIEGSPNVQNYNDIENED